MLDNDETVGAIAAKVTPPVGVSLATVYGYQVSELVLWATLDIHLVDDWSKGLSNIQRSKEVSH